MPTYCYRCEACGHEFEKLEKITASPRQRCPLCDEPAQRRISAGAGLVLKTAPSPAAREPGSCCGGGACGLN